MLVLSFLLYFGLSYFFAIYPANHHTCLSCGHNKNRQCSLDLAPRGLPRALLPE